MKKIVLATIMAVCALCASAEDMKHMSFEGIGICGDYAAVVDSLNQKMGWKVIEDGYLEGEYYGEPCSVLVTYSAKTKQASSIYIKMDMTGKAGKAIVADLVSENGTFDMGTVFRSSVLRWSMYNGSISIRDDSILIIDSYGMQLYKDEDE